MPRKTRDIAAQQELGPNERLKTQPIRSRHTDGKHAVNSREDSMIEMIDLKKQITTLLTIFERLDKGHIDTQQAIGELSGPALKKMVMHAFSEASQQKVSLDAIKQLLGMAGFTPVNKHVVGSVSADQSKEALLSLIAGSAKQLKQDGIEILDDREDSDKAE